LFFGANWAANLIAPVVDSRHKVIGSVFLIPESYPKRIPIKMRKFLFHTSVFLKFNFGLRSNKLYHTVHNFRIPVIVTELVNSNLFIQWLKKQKCDLIIIAGWSEKLDKDVINVPTYECINCHPSLLPRYRGPNPFYWVIVNNEIETGITLHYVDENLDAGDILFQERVKIDFGDTAGSLSEKCAKVAAAKIPEVLDSVTSGSVRCRRQNLSNGSY
jgi:methionyl-tRNA formyltransferase